MRRIERMLLRALQLASLALIGVLIAWSLSKSNLDGQREASTTVPTSSSTTSPAS